MSLPDGSPAAAGGPPAATGRAPALAVTNPSGNRSRVAIDPVPFLIGRQGENNLVLRDNRISRSHARISVDNGEYVVEDLDSRHGVFVNGQRVKRHKLKDGDRIDFGFPDSYRLAFTLKEDELNRVPGADGGAGRSGRQQSLQAPIAGGSGPRAAKLVVHQRCACRRGGCRTLGNRRRARLSAAGQGRSAGSEGRARPARRAARHLGLGRSEVADQSIAAHPARSAFDDLRSARRRRIPPRNVGGGPGAAQRGLRAADSGADRIDAGDRGHFAQSTPWACSTWIRARPRPIFHPAIAKFSRRWRWKPPPFSRTRGCSKKSAPSSTWKKS